MLGFRLGRMISFECHTRSLAHIPDKQENVLLETMDESRRPIIMSKG